MSSLNQNVIRHKIGLLNLATELGNVSKACKVMGLSRDTFYCYQNAVADGGIEALFESSRRKPNPKNRVEEATEAAVIAYATEQPAHGQVRVSNELRQRGIFVSPSGVRSIWLRNDLASFKRRLMALEKQVAERGIVLTDAQIAALEKKQDDNIAHGEIETAHPGYLGSQDTFYVGTIKGVGRIYQQTFVDTYSKVAMAKRYTTKTPITAADLLNDRVLPFFAEQGMGVIRILTDRGTEYCGKPETHDYLAQRQFVLPTLRLRRLLMRSCLAKLRSYHVGITWRDLGHHISISLMSSFAAISRRSFPNPQWPSTRCFAQPFILLGLHSRHPARAFLLRLRLWFM